MRRLHFVENDRKPIVILHDDQKWMPHAVRSLVPHPFKPGDEVVASDWIADRFNAGWRKHAVISGVRWFQYLRRQPPIAQVEILGTPMEWFAASHFSREP